MSASNSTDLFLEQTCPSPVGGLFAFRQYLGRHAFRASAMWDVAGCWATEKRGPLHSGSERLQPSNETHHFSSTALV